VGGGGGGAAEVKREIFRGNHMDDDKIIYKRKAKNYR
tara:strand:+ start:113 stop:223 length:111 start_codon:yes stop_codon:yes gene_type:complete